MNDYSDIFDESGPARNEPSPESQTYRDNLVAKRGGFRPMSREKRKRIEDALSRACAETGLFRTK